MIHNVPVVGVIGLEALADGGLPGDQFGDRLLSAPTGPGTQSWPYWQRDLRGALPSILSTLSPPTRYRR